MIYTQTKVAEVGRRQNPSFEFIRVYCLFILSLFLCSCAKKEAANVLKVEATPIPHGQMLDYIKPDLKKQGIELKVILVDDYNIPDRALVEQEVDANFFQHIPFMEEQIKNFHYPLECYARIHLEPMGIYSEKIKSLDELKAGDTIAVPHDPTNEYRALSILVDKGIIKLKRGVKLEATIVDIVSNPKKLKFREIDAALLPRTLREVAAAAIPTNFALQAHLNPTDDALALESKDSPYANIIAIRIGEGNNPKLQLLKKEMLSDKMRTFILEKYKGAILPVLKECPQ